MIGVYGGTFDPVHFGHLRTALEVREALNLDEVRFIPCRQPPHRVALASPEARVKMLELALTKEVGFVLDRRELDRPGPSYMIDTLASLRAELGGVTPLCLILGLDAFLGLPGWHCWRELPDLAHLIVMTRPGAPPKWPLDNPAGEPGCTAIAARRVPGMEAWHELAGHLNGHIADRIELLPKFPSGLVWFQPVTALDISASRIRVLLRTGRSARYLLPDAVLEYARASGLYQTSSQSQGDFACIPSLNP